MTLDNLEVLLVQPDFANPPRMAGKRGVRFMARGQARRLGIFPTGGTQHVLNHRFAFNTRVGWRELEDFFNSRSGSWGSFFVPGWHAEVQPLQTLAPGDTSLAVGAVNYAAVYLDAAKKTRTGHYIYLLNEAGDFHATKVLSATTGSPEILTLRDAVPDGVNFLLGKYHVGFLYNVRFMSDRLLFDFAGDSFASCETAMVEVVENSAVIVDEVHDPDPQPGPDGGTNAESGNDGNHYWLRCESPITTPPYGCPANAAAEITLPSDIGGPRPVVITIRGLSENKGYHGGTPDSPFYIGGTPDGGGANIFKLTVGTDVYFINYAIGGAGVFLLNYTRTVTMKAGDVIRLEYDSVDLLEYYNSTNIVVPGVPPYPAPFNGQFAQVDFTL